MDKTYHITCNTARMGTIRLGYRVFTWYARYGDNRIPYMIHILHPRDGHMVQLSAGVCDAIITHLFG